jgi:8-oxo-dGTP pyrophosphatase MutT (NUDIX family)
MIQKRKVILSGLALCLGFSLYGVVPRLSNFNFAGASVLPYTRWKPKSQGGKAHFLLAREAHGADKGTYDAFGGRRDLNEGHPVQTASREFVEETIGLIHNNQHDALKYIDVDSGNTRHIVANEKKKAVHYITKFAPQSLERLVRGFYGALGAARNPAQREKDSLAWVTWENLKKAIADAPRDGAGQLVLPVKVWANVINPNGTPYGVQINLRPFLVSSLQSFFRGAPYIPGHNPKIQFYNH